VSGVSIAVDGPGSSGKGTVARGVAEALGFQYVDTGSMYRSVALMALRRGVPLDDEDRLEALARALRFVFDWHDGELRVHVDGEDVTKAIRENEVSRWASSVSRFHGVREALTGLQRHMADTGRVVMDGRDIGTVVLPDATLKVYLDASIEVRAQRRFAELEARGQPVDLETVRVELAERDRQDMERAEAPLRVADDAVVIDSSGLAIEQAIEAVLALAEARNIR